MRYHPLTILVSPLDWGLGHASRMIPLIGHFVQDGHKVIVSGSGRSAELLRNTFPDLKFLSSPCHPVRMGPGKYSYFQLLLQLPSLVISIFREHRYVKGIVHDEAVDIIISDNRYGMRCRNAYSVLITHQVSPVLPVLFRWFEFPLYLILRNLIERFDQCWIPDFPDQEINLSGKLSHRYKSPSNARYIGILSRFSHPGTTMETLPAFNYEIAVVLSGPEPQVSAFERQICGQLLPLKKPAILLRGMRDHSIKTNALPDFGHPGDPTNPSMIHQVPHLQINSFSQILKNAGCVISRSGYSSIMDYIELGVPAILVPSPGQSEQEYLAYRMTEKGWFRCVKQDKLDLTRIDDAGYLIATTDNPHHLKKQDFQFIKDLYCEYYQDSN